MFEALNSVDNKVIKKSEDNERNMLLAEYNKALETLDISLFLKYRVKYDVNLGLYRKALGCLISNYTAKKTLEEVESNVEKYRLLSYRESVFNIARRNIVEKSNFVRARKLLNVARENGFFCNELYELEELLNSEWYPKA
ncbi:hypothetical protein EHEL_031120 [Encephalitozoon hellem ATCC 50504]|uniref:Uncharacterized protein n=1 Tax=Encephalitozoon hellem TaxID=27973 RepID=A0A9Q9C9A6_ENCHE|nr:uncharacterized protein EHEL_031120 [Encephalitozoon hellem ATCC 50504]AFM98008.1 hypothetical protein EHEL_031120 [Encephalitozoon hellem ATCC 50504]UTX42812.1 hypothetical protein GPU96_03g05350 [Encephalitozoon hellem]WEL38271.1 hypothetical protein PFJ87_03g01300 [Encephalitozoon hellem]|eukprot:XP_003886989.1 hypothetical protein EHEL_031120 [Encephalitozoon hellem ATCC 50504]